ncbi:PAAR domain-containing protein [Collimonas silvisoli]|uniref:PAAR domain-containing protein n=1 Tax=Collimonas silvisoli TaxID=2825884 RepID=UPI001B8D657C|nr:PAAR domain-containing protein [Collimonas silvisoli]
MKNAEGKAVIRLGDKTDHGGVVIGASATTKVMGIGVARERDMTHCPKCKGDFSILPKGDGLREEGRLVAHDDDETACGAKLISSLG